MTWVHRNVWGTSTVVAAGLQIGFLGSTPRAVARQAVAQAGARMSIWAGVYTAAQATRGQTLYVNGCAGCHTSNSSGNESGPALISDRFAVDWIGLTVAELFERTRVTMPQDNPGTLTPQQCADVIAFLLSANKYPAGSGELPQDAAALKQIHWDKEPPGPLPK